MPSADRRAEGNPGAGSWRGAADGRTAAGDDPDGAAPAGRAERIVLGAETGVRRVVRSAAVLLWIPCGFFFWLPFLLRRTVSYVFTLLYAGLTGGEPANAERRWDQAVGFYQTGFLRILHAFRSEEAEARASPRVRGTGAHEIRLRQAPAGGADEPGVGRFLLESLWAVLVWGAVVWLLGVWPDAPETLRSAALGAWDGLVAAGRQFDAWARELLGR